MISWTKSLSIATLFVNVAAQYSYKNKDYKHKFVAKFGMGSIT